MKHGTTNGYYYHKCRCDKCKEANRKNHENCRLKARSRPVPQGVHGTISGYGYWACRCDQCRTAMRNYRLEKREK